MHKPALLCLLGAVLLLLNACSSGSSDAPLDTDAHPLSWFTTHPEEVFASPDYADCVGCHGTDLRGSGDVVSCFSCHSFNDAPPFSIHPPDWTDAFADHRAFAAQNGFSSCAACHGSGLQGRQSAPSCFAPSFGGASCHADGPGEVPHLLDGSYLSGGNHGPDARSDLASCQPCHAEAGGPGSNPRFNVGINSVGGNGCETCHGINYAHPPNWPGHSLAGNLLNACTLCHGVALDGTDAVGVSCLECHTVNPGVNPTGCVSCHNVPPDGAAPAGNVSPNLSGAHGRVGHANSISLVPAETCDRCHSGAGTGTALHFDLTRPADLNLPFDPQDTIVPVSDGNNTTCTGTCHLSTFDVFHDGETWYDN